MAVRPLPSPRSRPPQPTVVELTSTNIAVAVAGLATFVAYFMLILVPAWTSYGRLWERESFSRDFIRLTGDGARYLIGRGVRVIGIDFLSIGDAEAHRELLGSGVIPVEGLDLRDVEAGDYELACLPLRLVGSDGAPARAVLIRY